MKLIVGLGNPGEKYKNTRHNVGFMLLDALAYEAGISWAFEKKFNSEISKHEDILYAKPQTFMNRSGEAVRKIADYYNIAPENIIIVHDDVDLEEGQTRFRQGSSSAGHHGVDDIIEKLGTQEFWRFRVGVGRPNDTKFDVQDYVLSNSELDAEKALTELKKYVKTL